jgi:uncharacterized protein (TIGR03000 family)
MLRHRFALMTLAVAGLAALWTPRPATAQYPIADRPSRSLYNTSYTDIDRPLRYGTEEERYATTRSAYPPVFYTSLYYPGIYGSHAYGVVASGSRTVRAIYTRVEPLTPYDLATAPPAGTRAEVPERAPVELRPAPAALSQPARINVVLPADATLSFQGIEMKTTGIVREFESPPLAPGRTYGYDVRATWKAKDGGKVVRTRHLTVRAGDRLEVDLNRELIPEPGEEQPEQRSLRAQPTPRLRDVPPPPRP